MLQRMRRRRKKPHWNELDWKFYFAIHTHTWRERETLGAMPICSCPSQFSTHYKQKPLINFCMNFERTQTLLSRFYCYAQLFLLSNLKKNESKEKYFIDFKMFNLKNFMYALKWQKKFANISAFFYSLLSFSSSEPVVSISLAFSVLLSNFSMGR